MLARCRQYIRQRIRYRIWGRYDTCPIPTPAERAHFL